MIDTVRGIRRLLVTIAVILLLIDAAAIALLLSPVGRGRTEREEAYDQVRQEFQAKLREIGPARDIDKKLVEARKQTDAFYRERIPYRYSDIADTLGKLASENHVQVTAMKYAAKDSEIAGLQKIDISTEISGDYNNQMRFINALEHVKPFFVIQSVDLAGAENGSVRLNMKLETFKRGGA
jgi:Tfp pilus assembly protein PilO